MKNLIQFNEKVDRLTNSKLIEWLYSDRKRPQDPIEMSKDWLALHGISKDEIDGFILNFRFLIQKRDGFSIDCLKSFYENLPNTFDDEKNEFTKEFNQLSCKLNERSIIQVKNKSLTKKEFFEIIFYGGMAHQNKDKIEDFKKITNSGKLNSLMFFMFLNVLLIYLSSFVRIENINQKAIEKNKSI